MQNKSFPAGSRQKTRWRTTSQRQQTRHGFARPRLKWLTFTGLFRKMAILSLSAAELKKLRPHFGWRQAQLQPRRLRRLRERSATFRTCRNKRDRASRCLPCMTSGCAWGASGRSLRQRPATSPVCDLDTPERTFPQHSGVHPTPPYGRGWLRVAPRPLYYIPV